MIGRYFCRAHSRPAKGVQNQWSAVVDKQREDLLRDRLRVFGSRFTPRCNEVFLHKPLEIVMHLFLLRLNACFYVLFHSLSDLGVTIMNNLVMGNGFNAT